MKLIVLTLILTGLCVFLLCFNIIFRKDGKFPETEINGIQATNLPNATVIAAVAEPDVESGSCLNFPLFFFVVYLPSD